MSRHSPKEIERIKRIAANASFGKPIAQGSLAAPSGSAKMRVNRGNRLPGFWKLPDRYEAWLALASSASLTANGYALHLKQMGVPLNHPDVVHWNKLFTWAYQRAKKLRPEWVGIYR